MVLRFDIKKHFPKILIGSIIGLAIGYFVLEEMASWEEMPLGQVFYIVLGCVLIAISGIALFVGTKLRFFPKKRKSKRSKPVFLEDQEKRRRSERSSQKPRNPNENK
jgi:hypothetical protein